jgi:predicted dehydrogenase
MIQGLVIGLAGLGDFGGRRLTESWIPIAQTQIQAGRRVEFFLAERDAGRLEETLRGLQDAGLRGRGFSDWQEMLDVGGREIDLLHVMTPSNQHHPSLCAAIDRGTPVIVGEKPWVLSAAELVDLRRCWGRGHSALLADFPEQFGSVVSSLTRYLEDHDMRVVRARTYRDNEVGEDLRRGLRRGVMGGSWKDKAGPHDVANSLAVTGPVSDYRIVYAETTRLMEVSPGRFLTENNTITHDPRAAADAEGRVRLVLEGPAGEVDVRLGYGWLGIPDDVRREVEDAVASFNLPPVIARTTGTHGRPEEDLRFSIFQAEGAPGDRAWLIAQTGYRGGVQPFAVVRRGREQRFLPLPDEPDPYRPMLQFALEVLFGQANPDLHTHRAWQVHEIMLAVGAQLKRTRTTARPHPAELPVPQAAWA